MELALSVRPGLVIISDQDVDALGWLRTRFVTATSVGAGAIEVELSDFLTNLNELADWPGDPNEVSWDGHLLALVEENAEDDALLAVSLDATPPTMGPALPMDPPWDSLTGEQERDVRYLLRLRHGANFSVPGAGKTRATLAVFEARRRAGEVSRLLVIAPKSAFESWTDEIDACFGAAKPVVQVLTSANVNPNADVLLVNYERLPDFESLLQTLLRSTPTLLVLDEAHRVKLGVRGAWGSVVLRLAPFARRRLILSGTPAPNGARDLENLFSFVWPGQGARSVQAALQGRDLAGASALLKPMFVRTTKSELNLPPLELVVRRLDHPPLHREIYQALLGTANLNAGGTEERDLESMGRVIMYLLMAATTPALLAAGASQYDPLRYRVPPINPPVGSSLAELMQDLPQFELTPKYNEVLSIVDGNARGGRKTLVWSTFVRNLTTLKRFLDPYHPAVVHGGTEDRDEQLRRFRQDPDCHVLLSNPATLGEGVSLHHECHDAVYVDRDFAAGRFIQSLDRIHRLGLPPDTRTCATVLISSGTIDEVVDMRLGIKSRFLGAVLDDPALAALADLDEEPSAAAGMDGDDVTAVLEHMRNVAG